MYATVASILFRDGVLSLGAAAKLSGLPLVDFIQHLLEKLFGTVLIPEAVQRECMAKSGEDSQRIQQAIDSQHLQVIPGDAVPFMVLPRSLGDGEKEAICLAIQHEHALLIVDDQLARRQAANPCRSNKHQLKRRTTFTLPPPFLSPILKSQLYKTTA